MDVNTDHDWFCRVIKCLLWLLHSNEFYFIVLSWSINQLHNTRRVFSCVHNTGLCSAPLNIDNGGVLDRLLSVLWKLSNLSHVEICRTGTPFNDAGFINKIIAPFHKNGLCINGEKHQQRQGRRRHTFVRPQRYTQGILVSDSDYNIISLFTRHTFALVMLICTRTHLPSSFTWHLLMMWLQCKKARQSQDPEPLQRSQLMWSIPECTWTVLETTFLSGPWHRWSVPGYSTLCSRYSNVRSLMWKPPKL